MRLFTYISFKINPTQNYIFIFKHRKAFFFFVIKSQIKIGIYIRKDREQKLDTFTREIPSVFKGKIDLTLLAFNVQNIAHSYYFLLFSFQLMKVI